MKVLKLTKCFHTFHIRFAQYETDIDIHLNLDVVIGMT